MGQIAVNRLAEVVQLRKEVAAQLEEALHSAQHNVRRWPSELNAHLDEGRNRQLQIDDHKIAAEDENQS